MWKGAIGFGLVSIQVKLYPATEEHGVKLHQVHVADGGRIRMKRVCEVDGEQVDYADIAKGYEDIDGRTAILTEDDLAELPLPSKQLIDVIAFIDADEIDPLRLSRAYYVGADSAAAAKPYVLLREALVDSGRVAVSKVALRTRESLALLRVHDDVLVLHTMHWPNEIRAAAGLAPSGKVTVRPQELKMATSLMDTLSEDFDLDSLHDDYQAALDELVTARLEGKAPPSADAAEPPPDNVVDLMSALQASIDARSEGEPGRSRTKKSAAKKSTAAKKTTGSKSGGGAASSGTSSRGTAKTTAKKSTTAKSGQSAKTAKSTKGKTAERQTATSRRKHA
ncbi:non-homologous end joining protein Ku [Streptomyces zagrosensis]|uniref:Non-homologous end joining protein Ku n=1 Tax=Streptomyces zagrosensis TaxID=1042984 RepID=A0A7W9V100_9ACTN|nr:DNA end-binding protein Ku [Streptomyces zagrosensis]